MDKKPLIGVSICAVVLLVLGSLSNVVGYQTVQSSSQSLINERINQKELLFQTIIDIANNKEIQRIILKSQINRGIFPVSEIPVLTKHQLRQMYFIGLILSKIISKSRMQSMVHKYQLGNQEMQKELSAVIEKDATLNAEITQLSNSECDCGNNSGINSWTFPVLCTIIFPIMGLGLFIMYIGMMGNMNIYMIGALLFFGLALLAVILRCYWMFPPQVLI